MLQCKPQMTPQWYKIDEVTWMHESRFGVARARVIGKNYSIETKRVGGVYCNSYGLGSLQEAIEIAEKSLGLKNFIVTYPSLAQVYPTNPSPDDIHIEDIAHHLSMICRFNGGTKWHYSVAQHSVLVSYMVSQQNQFAALMHDSAEAYMCDLVSPIKKAIKDYSKYEEALLKMICEKYRCTYPIPEEVHKADLEVRVKEQFVLRGVTDLCADMSAVEIEPWTPAEAEQRWMSRFDELYQP